MPEVRIVLHLKHIFRVDKNKGFTLLEILIATAIIAFLLTVITAILIRSIELFNKTKTRGTIQGNAIAALGMLSRELMETDARSVYKYTYDSDYPVIISFLSAIEMNGTEMHYDIDNGRMEWQKYIIYYLLPDPNSQISGNLLIRREYDPTDAATPPPSGHTYNYFITEKLFSTDFRAECNTDPLSAGNRVMAREIGSLDVTYSSSQRYMTLTFLVQRVGDDATTPEEVEYTTSIYFRNSM